MSENANSTPPRRHSLAGDASLLARNWRLVAGILLVSLAIFGVAHLRSAKSYAATASVAFQNSTLSQAGLNIAPAGSSEPQREADTEVYIAHSAEVAEAVRATVPAAHAESASELLSQVKVEAAPTADVLNIIATTDDPQLSAELANAFADQYIGFQAKAQLAGIETAQAALERQIRALPAGSSRRETLETALARIQSLRAVAGGSANVISRATPPTAPSGSGWSVTIVIALLVGFAIAFLVVLARETFNRRVRTVEDFKSAYGYAVLATVPTSDQPVVPSAHSPLLEPYRILRSAVDYAAMSRELDCVLITSAVDGEGQSTLAINLARALALSGRATVLAEFDLRRPAAVGTYALDSERGLTTVLAGEAALYDVLVQPERSLPNLRLLPSGALVSNPSELLRSQAVGRLLSDLTRDGTMVIIDSAPLNPVADTQGLLVEHEIDGVVLVARLDGTTLEEAEQARSILDQRGIEPIGLVVTHVRDVAGANYGSRPPADPARTGSSGQSARRPASTARQGSPAGAP
jgi:capsular exopolysaccharide synthesis family protein